MSHHCLDCPALAAGVLVDLIGGERGCCRFESHTLEERARLPSSWPARFRFGIVRRGGLIRQRSDVRGELTAIDAVGPGSAFVIEGGIAGPTGASSGFTGYALSRTLVCLCSDAPISDSLQSGGASARDLYSLQRDALERVERLAHARARSSAVARVAALLCALDDTFARRAPQPRRIPACFAQRDLGALVSLRHESVCRALRELAEAGFIAQSRDGTEILDRQQLELL